MCGITGFIDLTRSTSKDVLLKTVNGMADALKHRGPDRSGAWSDASAGIALGFRRLSIVDLSSSGDQPMISASGRFVICYNGEIYNAEEIRAELGSRVGTYRGHSDTEVLLEAIAAWGLDRALSVAVGMFAIALWDRHTRQLWLVRDRLGKKPLYWSLQNQLLLFGSELRALRAHPRFKPEMDRDALVGFVRRGYFLHPHTVYRGVSQLEPGAMVRIGPDGRAAMHSYWTLHDAVRRSRATPFRGSSKEAVDALEHHLRDAVRQRMVADVPIGALLSGGYDSSTVVALMQAQSNTPVRTFSIGFSEDDYDEATHAGVVARHLGTDHTQLIVTPQEAQAVIPRLPELYDEPFADSSQIPTFLVSQLARRQVTVALSGDGGDEVFAGYNRYLQGDRVRRQIAVLPRSAQRAIAAVIRSASPGTWDCIFRVLPERARPRHIGDKFHKLSDIVSDDDETAYLKLTSPWPDPRDVVVGGRETAWPAPDQPLAETLPLRVERMQYLDTISYLAGDILTKLDRASMAVSLEARTPILDHRVVEFAWSLPLGYKICAGSGKWAMRQVLYRYLPAALVERPKSGFAIPVGSWLRGPLRDWAEDLLDEGRLEAAGMFNPRPIRARWEEHLSGRRNWQGALWSVLMFQAWRRVHAP